MVLLLKKGVQKMTTITLKVSEADKTFMKAMAKFEGVSLSELIRTKTLEALEDEYDARVADLAYQEYLEDLEKGVEPITWEEMMLETPDKLELLSLIDILVDGRYDKSKRNLMLQFRGSSNQRIIDVQKSLKSGQVVIWDKLNDGKESYEQVKRE